MIKITPMNATDHFAAGSPGLHLCYSDTEGALIRAIEMKLVKVSIDRKAVK